MDLVYSDLSGEAGTITTDTAVWVQSCGIFRTLEQHSSSLGQGERNPTDRVLEELRNCAQAGFLISDEQFIAHCKAAAGPESSPPAIATLGATTRNRPELLRRGFASFIENARIHGRRHDYVVIDDGLNAEEQSATRSAAEALSKEFDVAVRYATRQQRLAFAQELGAVAEVAPEIVEFAVLGDAASAITTGAARNSLLLDTVGDLYLMVDDDSVCRVTPSPEMDSRLALDARANSTELWFYHDRETLLREAHFVAQDPLAAHETILGRRVADCLPAQDHADNLDLTYATAELAQPLWEHGGRVLATSAGVVGDSGMGSTAYLTLTPESQARLVRSEQEYVSAVVNRQILRVPSRKTISRGTFCAGASLGLDNRVLLPPFVPVQRNSDGLFARTLRRCFRDGYKGYLPWAVLHDPLPPRKQSLEGAAADATRIRLIHILRALITTVSFAASADPRRDLRRLGAELIEIASLPRNDFQHFVKPRLVWDAATYLQGIHQAQSAPGTPEFFARRQKAYWQQLSEALSTEQYFIPRDLDGAGTTEEVQRAAQRVVLRFGRLLQEWSALVEAATMLRGRGVRLAKPV